MLGASYIVLQIQAMEKVANSLLPFGQTVAIQLLRIQNCNGGGTENWVKHALCNHQHDFILQSYAANIFHAVSHFSSSYGEIPALDV